MQRRSTDGGIGERVEERHQLSDGRRGLPKFRVGIWDTMDGLGRARAIVVANALGGDTADVIDAEEDEVV